MSFGLLTATEVHEIPEIMRRIAGSYRSVETRRFKEAWLEVADLLDKYADEAEAAITRIKAATPRSRQRVRL